MADTSATIIAASLSSEELEKSIDKLVGNVATATDLIRKDFDDTVSHIKKTLSSIGDIKINTGGSGTSKGGTGLKQVEQEAKSATASLDNFAKTQQVAIRTSSEKYRNADELETMKIQLDILRQRLVETRQQYSSFVAMAANATKTGDEGLYKFATSNVHAFEAEAKNLIQQIRGVQNAILQMGDVIAPQGHLIQNWVASIGKVSPELRQLGEQIKNNSLLAKQSASSTRQSTEEETQAIRRRIAEERQASIQTAANERRRREAIFETGKAAQETSRSIVRDMYKQLNSDSKEPIKGIRDLQEAFNQMKRAWFQLGESDRTSAIGRSLIEDMARAKLAIKAIQDYNKEIAGVRNIDPTHAHEFVRSYAQLQNSLKTLTDQYKSLSREERNSAKGTELIDKIHSFNREIRDIQRTMSKPTSLKKALGLDESTLDRINDKLQALRAYKGGLKITDPKQLEEMRQVDVEINRLQKEYDKLMSKNNQMVASNNALGRSWNYMKNRLAFYFTVGASTQFIKNLIEVRSQYEMNERALGILIGSAERGTQVFSELSQMALVSPYTLIELSNAAKQLTAYDIAAKDVVDTTRRLADMASAVGVPMERLTYALGQIKAYGYLNSRDARMFANAGIPLVRELSKYYSELEGKVVSVGDVYDRMKKKAIDFNSVMAVVTKMTDEGGKFFDFQAKMADTLKVRLANLTLAWNNMLNDMGASEQGVLTGGIAALKNLFLHWKDIESTIKKVVVAFGLFKAAQFTALAFMGDLTSAMAWQTLVGKRLQTTFVSLTSSIKASSLAIGAAGAAFWMILAEGIVTYMKNAEEVERLNQSVSDGAKEAAKNLNEFLESAEIEQAKLSAQTGKLPKSEAEKTWDALREQIELSSASANDIIPKLLEISDLNSRLTLAFDLAERIKKANENLGDLNNTLDFTQDTILGGLFGEGVVEDIEDYNEHLAYASEETAYLAKKNHSFFENAAMGIKSLFNNIKEDLGSSTEEAENEIVRFAHSAAKTIKDELGEEGLKDSVQINEAIARVLKGFEQQFPQIKGKGKMLFETIFNDVMAQEFNGAVDKQTYYYKLFLERLKKDHASAFQGVTDDILKETHRWSSGQQDAIKKTAEKVKTDLPLAAQDAIDQILNQLNNTDFKLRIVTEFATTTLDDVQKQFREKFIEKDAFGNILSEKDQTERQQKYGSLMIKNNESDLEYQERIKKEKQKQLDISKAEGEIISKNQGKTDDWSKAIVARATEAKKAADNTISAIKDIESGGYDFTTKKENAAASKAQKAAESELQKALKDELQLIDKVRSQYKKLTDAGATDGEALAMVTNQFANSLAHVNKVLGKNNIPLFDMSKFAGTDNPHALLDMLKLQLDSAKIAKNIKPEEIKELEVKYSDIKVDAEAYDLTKITKGLNNELDRLKDEYELAVSLDADPELGNMFADWMGIDMEDLPRTASEYAKRYTDILNKKLKEYNANIELPNLLNITDDDLRELQNRVGTGGITQKYVDDITNGVKAVREVFGKEKEDTSRDWNALIEKYGGLQAKILKIYKDNVQQQASIVREFGTNDEQIKALDLISKIKISQDPAEIARLQEELAKVMNDVTSRNPVALKTYQAVRNEQESQTGKAYWEDFKDSDLYSMTFTDMANNSTRAIQLIMDKLEMLKDKVKEDPASMKALIKSLEDAEKELNTRDPFGGIARSLRDMANASQEAKTAQENLRLAEAAVEKAQQEVDNAEDGTPEEQAAAQQKLADAIQRRTVAQTNLTKAENKGKKAQENLKSSLQGISNQLGNVQELFGVVSKLFRAGGDDETADAIDSISEGFSTMTTVIMGVVAAMILLESSQPWLLAIAAALSVIVGLVSFLSGRDNKRIDEEIKDSERAVKRLELAYVDLQQAVDKAYGTATIGAKQATLANKELQLAEIQRQIQLEKSRTGKNRDEDKIIDLQKQYNELFYEIKNGYTEIVDDLMGTDVASFAENLVSSMIDAFKQGEDYMKVFSDKFDEMIDNMIMKSIVSRVVSQYLDAVWSDLDKRINERTKDESGELAKAQNRATEVRNMSDDEIKKALAIEQGAKWYVLGGIDTRGVTQEMVDEYRKAAQDEYDAAQKRLDAASAFTDSDIDYVMGRVTEIMPELGEKLQNILGQYYKFGESSETQLSALQQGIQGITEDTAGALEAITNGISQQCYLQSDILIQIRDTVQSFDIDIQTASLSQILLQLQSSYQLQQSMLLTMENWTNPSGNAVRVELIS